MRHIRSASSGLSRRPSWRIRPRSGRSSADIAFRLLLVIGVIAGNQSSGVSAKRHLQDNLFLAPAAGCYRLVAAAVSPHALAVSRLDGRPRYGRKAAGEESPGSIDIRCRITSGGGDPRESATENEPLPARKDGK